MVNMAARRPSKKRNALLVFEFLTKEASKRLVAGDSEGASTVINLMKEAFANGKELHKEYRLANAMLVAKVSSRNVAERVLSEAKKAACSLDENALEEEKTRLIAEIDRLVDAKGFVYEAQLPDYRIRSTIGTLIHDWRSSSPDFARLAQYEEQIVEHLSSQAADVQEDDEMEKMSIGERRALLSVMSRKLEEKWGNSLSREQKALLRDYALGKSNEYMLERLNVLKKQVISCLEEQLASPEAKTSEYYHDRLVESKNVVEANTFDSVDDKSISMGMLYIKLLSETSEEK